MKHKVRNHSMMAWKDNLVLYAGSKSLGTCPNCGSRNVNVLESENGKRYSITFTCKDCGDSAHFDGGLR